MSATSPAISRRRKKNSSRALTRSRKVFRTTEAPGTIIIDTKGRFLYLVQGNPGRFATASASAATASRGPACRKFHASRNGRIGVRRRR